MRVPCPVWPSKAADDETMIITPRSPSASAGFVVAMYGAICRIRSRVPRMLTERTKSRSERGRGSMCRSNIYEELLVVGIGLRKMIVFRVETQ